jgi:hypothetical protein
MNKSLLLIIASAATISLQGFTADLFDSPGPGYRQQVERVKQAIEDRFRAACEGDVTIITIRGAADPFNVSLGSDVNIVTPAGESLLSRPIRLTLSGPVPAAQK